MMEKDQQSKISKTKTDVVEKQGKNKKISDFFTTPDKTIEKQKQKSLLSFFAKSSPNEHVVNDPEKTIEKEVTAPQSNSDKENNDNIVDIETVKDNESNDLGNKSVKKPLFLQNSGCTKKEKSDKLSKKKGLKQTDLGNGKKNKSKKNNAQKGSKDSLTESVILLSDSNSNSCEPVIEGKNSANLERKHKKIKSEDKGSSSEDLKIDRKQDVEVISVNDQTNAEINNISAEKLDREVKENNKNTNHKSEKTDKKMPNEKLKDNCSSVKQKDGETLKCKKTALKGKDMLNLLKEIQSEEEVSVKKKKHKKKHKHKDKFEVNVHEITNSECVTEQNEGNDNKETGDDNEVIDVINDDDELKKNKDKKKTKLCHKERENVEKSKEISENKSCSDTVDNKEVVIVDEDEGITMEVNSKKKKLKKKYKHMHKDKSEAEVEKSTETECITEDNEISGSKIENKVVKEKETVGDVVTDHNKLTLEAQKDKKKRKHEESKTIKKSRCETENINDLGTEINYENDVQDEHGKIKSKSRNDKKKKHLSLTKEDKNDFFSKQKSVKMANNEKNDSLDCKGDDKGECLSYGSFKKNFKKDENDSVKTTPGKEMSYSDYLKLMNQKDMPADDQDAMACEDVDIIDCENITVDDIPNDAIDGVNPVCGEVEKNVDSKNDRKKDISNFFKVMTSTPDGSKKAAKNIKNSVEGDFVDIDAKNKVFGKKSEKSCSTGKSGKESIKCEDIETIEIETINGDKNEKFKHLNSKHKQATLSFGKNGLTVVAKPIVTSDENPVGVAEEKDIVNNKVTNDSTVSVKKKRGRPRKVVVQPEDLNITDSSVFATPDKVGKIGAKNKKRKMDTSSSIDSSLDFSDKNDRRRSMRKRYKVEAFQMDADRKTPIKIKLKRCPKSSSSGDDVEKVIKVRKPETNSKQTAAQALLEKAKKRKMKKHSDIKDKLLNSKKLLKHKKKKSKKSRNESNSSEDSVTRRSSRLEGRVMASMEEVSLENIVISSSDEDNVDYKVKKKSKKKKSVKVEDTGDANMKGTKLLKDAEVCTPTKDKMKKVNSPMKNSPKNSKKSGMKLAPMFLKGKSKNVENSPKKPVLDPEQVKQRQQFLMSGVPEELKKQTAARMASLVDADYPPFPRDNHIIQMPMDTTSVEPGLCNVWGLSHINLPLRCLNNQQIVQPKSRFTGDLMNSYHSTFNDAKEFKSFSCHKVLTSTDIDKCIQEIQSYNTLYPSQVMYKCLLEMKRESDKPPVKSESMLKTDMKGILSGCEDMVVIDDEDDKKTDKKQNDLKKEEIESKDKLKSAGCSMLWTEKYCPIKSSDILGNAATMKKLKVWLTEWKHVLDREARKARKLLMKKNKGKQLTSKKDENDDIWDDDSDFDMDSDDSDDDDSLCNTVLLTGPHGCGKTSSVYALALELGFKVHEVNASTCRSGKQILSQLQEATQSHQVSSLGSLTPRKNVDQSKAEGSKVAQSFTNLFKKAVVSTEDKTVGKDGGKKRKRNKSDKDDIKSKKRKSDIKHNTIKSLIEDSNSQMAANCIKISSTTLILFDEVDVVFDEDKGFLSAIQTFMSKTKIPIILTTADPGFTHIFDGRYEIMNMKRPSMVSVCSHLQVISLVENVRLEHETLLEMVQLYGGDVRKCLTTLQFILLSGGGHCQKQKAFQLLNVLKPEVVKDALDIEASQSSNDTNNAMKTVQAADDSNKSAKIVNDDDDDDFVVLKPLKKRRRVFDDDSNSVDSMAQISSAKSTNTLSSERNTVDEKFAIDCSSCCTIHSVGLETIFKKGHLSVVDTLSQGLKSRSSLDIKDMICTSCRVQRSTKTDVYYNNLHHFLPFNYKVVDSVCKGSQVTSGKNDKARNRIKHFEGLYDSEESHDSTDIPKIVSSDVDDLSKDASDNSTNTKEENQCLIKSLSSFSKFYETLSCLDVIESKDRMKMTDSIQCSSGLNFTGHLVAGVDNMLPQFDRFCETNTEVNEIYSSEIKSRSMCQLYQEMETVKQCVGSLSKTNIEFEEKFILPIMKPSDKFSLIDQSRISMSSDYRRAYENINDSLPTITHSQHRTKHLDYLPCLRQICRTEQCRQITNAKRRFHHYLDAITFPLKDRTISTLATTFS